MTRTHSCSFCGKRQEEVQTIIAGPGVGICGGCVWLCVQILLERKTVVDFVSPVERTEDV